MKPPDDLTYEMRELCLGFVTALSQGREEEARKIACKALGVAYADNYLFHMWTHMIQRCDGLATIMVAANYARRQHKREE